MEKMQEQIMKKVTNKEKISYKSRRSKNFND